MDVDIDAGVLLLCLGLHRVPACVEAVYVFWRESHAWSVLDGVFVGACVVHTLTCAQVYILYCAVVLSYSEPLEEMTHSYGFGVVFIGVGGFVGVCSATSLI